MCCIVILISTQTHNYTCNYCYSGCLIIIIIIVLNLCTHVFFSLSLVRRVNTLAIYRNIYPTCYGVMKEKNVKNVFHYLNCFNGEKNMAI